MTLSEVIQKRKSIRRYEEGDVPNETILEMIDAARYAPSAKNIQNWHFLVVKNRGLMQKIADTIEAKHEKMIAPLAAADPQKAERSRKFCKNFTLFFLRAPVLVLVLSKAYVSAEYQELRETGLSEEDVLRIQEKSPGMQSFGAAVEHFILKATELGYGTCWMTSPNYAIREIGELLKREAGFEKEGYELAAVLSLGIPPENANSPSRKPVEEISTFIK